MTARKESTAAMRERVAHEAIATGIRAYRAATLTDARSARQRARLRELRERAGLSVEDAADGLGVLPGSLRLIESGAIPLPRAGVATKWTMWYLAEAEKGEDVA